jgi:integrase
VRRAESTITSFRRRGERDVSARRIALTPGYRFDATQALRQVLARAVVWGMIDANPAKVGVDNPSSRRREQRPFESWAELDAVAAYLSPRYRPMVIFAAATGLRPAEWLALEWRDLNLEARCLRAPLVHQRAVEVPEDRAEPPRGAAADDRAPSARTAASESVERTRVPRRAE